MITVEHLLLLGFEDGGSIYNWEGEDISGDGSGFILHGKFPLVVGERYVKKIGRAYLEVDIYNGVSKCQYFQGICICVVGYSFSERESLEYCEIKMLLAVLKSI